MIFYLKFFMCSWNSFQSLCGQTVFSMSSFNDFHIVLPTRFNLCSTIVLFLVFCLNGTRMSPLRESDKKLKGSTVEIKICTSQVLLLPKSFWSDLKTRSSWVILNSLPLFEKFSIENLLAFRFPTELSITALGRTA